MISTLRYISSLDPRPRGATIELDGQEYEVIECVKTKSGMYLITAKRRAK